MGVVFLVLGVVILAISAVFAYKRRYDTKKCIAAFTLGILFATFFMIMPTEWVKEGKVVENPTLYSILASLLYSFKALTGRQDIAQLETVALSGTLKTVYIYISYIIFTLAPVSASGLILTFIGDTGEKLRYFFSFSKKYYVFSEINQNSLALAKGIKDNFKRKTIIFCNTKSTKDDLLAEAKKLGAITLHKSCKNFKLIKCFSEYEFYFVSENEDNNIALTEEFILKKEKLTRHKITVNSFAQSGVNTAVMESMFSKKPCAVFESTQEVLINKAIEIVNTAPKTSLVFFNSSKNDEKLNAFLEEYSEQLKDRFIGAYPTDWKSTSLDDSFKAYDISLYYAGEEKDKDGKMNPVALDMGLGYRKGRLLTEWQDEPLKIRFIDEIALFCNSVIFEHPLYKLPNGLKDISVLLVGCGRLGTQMLKTVFWCGQLEGYTLKIRVLDKNAQNIEKEIFSACPEMKNRGIEFKNIDIESPDFEKTIFDCSDATFVCVATGSDELNIATAENIYRIFRRKYTGYTPPIFTRIRKIIKSSNFDKKGSFLSDRKINLFGTTNSIFSNKTLFNSELENLSFAVHLCYNWALDKPKDSFEYQKALNDFYSSEYSRRSSMAAALHIPYKIRSCGVVSEGSIPTEAELNKFIKELENDTKKQALIKNEHERWNAFMRSEGFRTVDFETVKKYSLETRSHKDEIAKLHPCIIDWESLDDLQKEYNELQQRLYLKKSNFKEYDEKLVTEIPLIIKRANELSKEGF